jgi:hypothetical protein
MRIISVTHEAAMNRLLPILLLPILSLPSVGIAQGEPLSATSIERSLKQLNLPSTKNRDSYSVQMRKHTVTLRRQANAGGVTLSATAKIAGTLPTPALTKFNEQQTIVAQLFVGTERDLILEAQLAADGNMADSTVRKFLLSYDHDLQELDALTQKGKAALPIDFTNAEQKSLVVKFPTNDANWETAWKIDWDVETIGAARKAGMVFPKDRTNPTPVLFKIKKASFKPGPKAPWVQVLEDAHPSELYVPYYFRDTRFFDLRDAGEYVPLSAKEGGPRGMTLGKDRFVMAELRDRGVAYKNEDHWRRGEELALWANFNAGNYTYLIEFGFMDDGAIAFRHAPTGYNLSREPFTGHMHNCCWRIGMNLALENELAPVNTVGVAKWPSDTPHAANAKLEDKTYGVDPIKTEGFRDWEPKDFTKIRVMNPNVQINDPNGPNARPISYDLVPLVQGIARHRTRPDESFTKHDFWITRADSKVTQYVHLGDYFDKQPPRDLTGGKLVLWHMSSALHVPRSEDGILKGSALANGQALASWTTVELRPRHLFTGTPIYRGPK